ncbi:hypothetical protein [Parasphingorhabdus cellanae]|uniref:Lipoprotein n=1 Tax=Parasphingorhabdus cellanae TaxID=2806553 RepID=A0ABX7T4N4_9SPHN|nr:hypothetical protein [Parasphingorhabdus cellanae]QTD55215.1 hypothetical protein J4G78_13435 [Parasphingorhabdus cellanae]
MLPLMLAGCASSTSTGNFAEKREMIFVPPVDIYETTNCISLNQVRSTKVIDRIGIAYEMPDRKIWLNRPKWGASTLNDDLVMVAQAGGDRLCSGDIIRVIDRTSIGYRGSLALGQFISYSEVQ